MAVNWSLFTPVDLSGKFNEGWDRGEKMREKAALKSALAAFGADPSSPEAQSALAAASPQFAMSMAEQRWKEQADIREKQRIASFFTGDQSGIPAGLNGKPAKRDYRGLQQRAIMGGETALATQFGALADDQERQAEKKGKTFANIAYPLLNIPDEAQRRVALMRAAPALKAQGYTDEELGTMDLSDAALGAAVSAVTDPAHQRDIEEIKIVPNAQGTGYNMFDYLGNWVGNERTPPVRAGGRVYAQGKQPPAAAPPSGGFAPSPDPLAPPPEGVQTPSGNPTDANIASMPGFDLFGPLPPNAQPGETMEPYLIRMAREQIAREPHREQEIRANLMTMVNAYRAGRQ